jgi:hypothetical protein
MNLLILFRIFFAKQHSMAIMQHYIFFLSREEKPILREESCAFWACRKKIQVI